MEIIKTCPTLWCDDNKLHHPNSLQITVIPNNEIFPCEVWNCPYKLDRDPILPACVCGFVINRKRSK